MVTLSAMTVEDEEYEVKMDGAATSEVESGDVGGVGGDDWQMVCGVKAKPIKILLTKDVSEITHVEAYQDGANVDAWLDENCTAFVLIDDGKDLCYLGVEEFEILDGPEAAGGDDNGDGETTTVGTMGTVKSSYKVTYHPTGAMHAHLVHQKEIADASATVAACAVEWAKAQEAAKSAKKQFEGAVEDLRGIIGRGPEVLPLFDQPASASEKSQTEGYVEVIRNTPTDPSDESWRATPIDEIFLGIRGLGKKKREAIREAIPTLGAFEDLRKKASVAGDPLREHMPKGIGQEACDQLEEASLNAISRILTLGDDDQDNDEDDYQDPEDDEWGR